MEYAVVRLLALGAGLTWLEATRSKSELLERVAREFLCDNDRLVVYAACKVVERCRVLKELTRKARWLLYIIPSSIVERLYKARIDSEFRALAESGLNLYRFTRPDLLPELERRLSGEAGE